MRIYLPASVADLNSEHLGPTLVHAVTDELRATFPEEGEEDLEVVAFLLAADSSLAQLATQVPARVVISAEVDEVFVRVGTHPDPTAVELVSAISWDAVVSIHTDDPGDGEVAVLVQAALLAGPGAEQAAADLDLLWWDVSERDHLVALFDAAPPAPGHAGENS